MQEEEGETSEGAWAQIGANRPSWAAAGAGLKEICLNFTLFTVCSWKIWWARGAAAHVGPN
uniref:Uncharacterized protein n=1 Tax=Arundo donax TaxID=35708 RepID=A0A0A9G8F8_ARUDO